MLRRPSPARAKAEAKAAPKRRSSSRRAASPGPEGRAAIKELSEQKRQMLQSFQTVDKNRDGVLDTKEVATVLQSLDSTTWTAERLLDLMASIDKHDSGQIHFSEFVDWLFSDDTSTTSQMFMSALEELPACAFDSADYEFWKVVYGKGVNVREAADKSAEKIGSKSNGMYVAGRREGDWLALSGELGFMLIETAGSVMLEKVVHTKLDMSKAPASSPLLVRAEASDDSEHVPSEETPATRLAFLDENRASICSRMGKGRWMANDHVLFMHGMAYAGPMIAPKITWKCETLPRPDHAVGAPEWLTASEFNDTPEVSRIKCQHLAHLMRLSRNTVLYTGAGISAAVIGQAALSGQETVGWKTKELSAAEPTFTHHALGILAQQGWIHGWVQQNHDGLPQKAGFPQECINEIHGSWFDPCNPVVKYTGALHKRMSQWMRHMEETADLVLVLGTSLSGLTADTMALNAAYRSISGEVSHPEGALGAVCINLQQTRHDGKMALRLFDKTDRVCHLLLQELGCGLPTLARPVWPTESRVLVPYGSDGKRVLEGVRRMWWDLSDHEEVQLIEHNCQGAMQPQYMHIGREPYGESRGRYTSGPGIGWVKERDESRFCFKVVIEGVEMKLGIWWLEVALRGAVELLPLVNTEPLYEGDTDGLP